MTSMHTRRQLSTHAESAAEPTAATSGSIVDAATTAVADPIAVSAVAEVAAKIGDLKALGLANFTPVGLVERALEAIHVTAGLPWWVSIIAATAAARVCLLPFTIRGQREAEKLKVLHPRIKPAMEGMQAAKLAGDKEMQQFYIMELAQLYQQHKVSPFAPILAGTRGVAVLCV
jgi:YidC/Oxa1 family membrane protein insertase